MNLYEKAAKAGLLGTKAKISAESKRAEWSSDPNEAKKRAIEASMKKKGGVSG